jgi:hypothetical protein
MFVEKSEVDLKATVSEVKVTKQVVDPSAP